MFTFNEELHLYFLEVDGVKKPLTGVTSVLQAIAKPALIQWSANEAVKYILEKGVEKDTDFILISKEQLEEARTAHRRKKKDAGQKGTDIHAELEKIIKEAITGDGYITSKTHESKQISDFIDWAVSQKVKFLASEKRVYSKIFWLGGTLDFICEIDGKKYIGDIKTSNKIYGREFFAQTAAYRLMCEEQGETDFAGSVIVRI